MLLVSAVTAMIWANSPWQDSYHDLWEAVITVDLGFVLFQEDLQHWVNDGLMALFFFVVGLEIKREMTHGELSSKRTAALPVIAALGGMIVPATIYFSLNVGGDGQKGWGIPMATDIAFALGVLALVGRGIPSQLRIFLLTLAIADDIGAILVIAVFYTSDLSFTALGLAGLFLAGTALVRRLGVVEVSIYLLLGIGLWAAMLKSGIHATLAGVILGLLTPASAHMAKEVFLESLDSLTRAYRQALHDRDEHEAEAALGEIEDLVQATEAPVERLERILHPFTSYLVIPVFALANAGLEFSGDSIRDATTSSVTLGIAIGLLAGKFFGILGASWLAVRLGLADLPSGGRWSQIAGVAMLAGIGFTVSLFITGLAFDDEILISDAKMGIFGASLIAGISGYTLLRLTTRPT